MPISVCGQGQCSSGPATRASSRHCVGVKRTRAREDCPVVSIRTVYVCHKVDSVNVDLVYSVISGQYEN